MKTIKFIAITILSIISIATLVSCEDANVENGVVLNATDMGAVTRAARISNIYLAKGWKRYHCVAYNTQTEEENAYYISKAKEHLTAPVAAQRTLVNELLARDWEYGVRMGFDNPNKHSANVIMWAEACMTKLSWDGGSYTKAADDVIAELIENVLDKELGRTMKACPDASRLKQNALLVEDAFTPGPSTERLQKVREVLNFDWEAGKEFERLVPGRTYKRHELIIMLSETPMPTYLRARAIRWVDGL